MSIVFLKLTEVCRITGKSKSTVYSDIREGIFTRPVPLSARSSAWPAHEVESINRARLAGAGKVELQALVEKLHQARSEGAQAIIDQAAG